MARILVIDDSASALELAGQILRQAGHEVVTAESGKQGVSILASQALDLVITDIYMPEEDGLEVIRNARRSRPGLRVLAMSVDLLAAVESCLRGSTEPGGRRTDA